MAEALRNEPLADRVYGDNSVLLTPLPACERLVVRADAKAVAGLGKAFGVALPKKPRTSTVSGDLSAWWIGPDEWFVTGPYGSDLEAKGNKAKGLYSIVSVDHRNTGMTVAGPKAALALNSGCPRDLSLKAFPVGSCARTMISKAEVLLRRTDEETFRIECWRSFSDYVWKYMVSAIRSA